MPDLGHSAADKRFSNEQERATDDHKEAREPSRAEYHEQKGEQAPSLTHHAESKETHLPPSEKRGRKLSSLPGSKRAAFTSPEEKAAFSSFPSPSTESGKLAPLGPGQTSPRPSSSLRLSIRSHSPVRGSITDTSRGADANFPPSCSGSNTSPRNTSPRLPAMKSPPSPRPDETLPELSARGGSQSARRVRSVSPKRVSYADSIGTNRPDGRGTGAVGRIAPLLDAKASEHRRDDLPIDGDTFGRNMHSIEPRRKSLEPAASKSAASTKKYSGSKSCSPPRIRGGDQGFSAEREQVSMRPRNSSTSDNFEHSSRPSLEGHGQSSRRSDRRKGAGADDTRAAPALSRVDRESAGESSCDEEKRGGTPASPSSGRGEDSETSPRTRRMRPQRHNTP